MKVQSSRPQQHLVSCPLRYVVEQRFRERFCVSDSREGWSSSSEYSIMDIERVPGVAKGVFMCAARKVQIFFFVSRELEAQKCDVGFGPRGCVL